MAALKLRENMDFDAEDTYQHVKTSLPSYARPRFIRIQVDELWPSTYGPNKARRSVKHNNRACFRFWQDTLAVTGTFKQTKMTLAEEGFDPSVTKDPLFFLKDDKGYVAMTQDIFNSIAEGRLRL